MTRQQLEAMIDYYDRTAQTYLKAAADSASSLEDRRMSLTLAGIAGMQMDALRAALSVDLHGSKALPLKTETEDRRSLATYDDLKEFVATYISTHLGNSKVHLDRDTVLHDYLEMHRIDELAWMIWRNFKISDRILTGLKLDMTLDDFITFLLKKAV